MQEVSTDKVLQVVADSSMHEVDKAMVTAVLRNNAKKIAEYQEALKDLPTLLWATRQRQVFVTLKRMMPVLDDITHRAGIQQDRDNRADLVREAQITLQLMHALLEK